MILLFSVASELSNYDNRCSSAYCYWCHLDWWCQNDRSLSDSSRD